VSEITGWPVILILSVLVRVDITGRIGRYYSLRSITGSVTGKYDITGSITGKDWPILLVHMSSVTGN